MDADLFRQLLPDDHGFEIDDLNLEAGQVVVRASITISSAVCPDCGHFSDRVHSRYVRQVQDRACCGHPMCLVLRVRKFKCTNWSCQRKIFCERLPGLAEANAQTTSPLTGTQEVIGLVVGGEPGSRLCKVLAMPTSADTLLRRARSYQSKRRRPPRHVGVDDWAFKKRHNYGTIIIDHDLGEIIELLDGRDGEELKRWLAENPQVELITRDRWISYAKAAEKASPHAKQSADRWHLLKNLREAVERLLSTFSKEIAQAVLENSQTKDKQDPPEAKPLSVSEQLAQAKKTARREQHRHVRSLHEQGTSIHEIARRVGIARRTVRRYLADSECPDWKPGQRRHSGLDQHRPFIKKWIAEGGRNAAMLHRHLTDQGVKIGYRAVSRYIQPLLGNTHKPGPRPKDSKPKPELKPPSAARLSYSFIHRPSVDSNPAADSDKPDSPSTLERLRQSIPELNEALELAGELASMYRRETSGSLSDWIDRAATSRFPALATFAEALRSDQAAIEMGITEHWSNGPTEGHVNRLKTIKRMMYGRGKLDLLKARATYAG